MRRLVPTNQATARSVEMKRADFFLIFVAPYDENQDDGRRLFVRDFIFSSGRCCDGNMDAAGVEEKG